MPSEDSSTDRLELHKWKACKGCGHRQHSMRCRELTMPGAPGDIDECGCLGLTSEQNIATTCRGAGGCPEHPITAQLREEPEEPPLTPEEEEVLPPPEGPEYTPCVCGHIEPLHRRQREGWTREACRECDCLDYRTKPDFEIPPQPVRRPPYAVAYSVAGHLYEVALPGDATVAAVDGALVIKHAVGFVAGITGVYPIENKEAS